MGLLENKLCGTLGLVAMEGVTLSRNGAAPGEWVTVSGTFTNLLSERHCDVVVRLERRTKLFAEGRTRSIYAEWELLRVRINNGDGPLTLQG